MTLLAVIQDRVAIDTTLLLVGLFGGLAVFLHGMEGMSESLRLMAGNRLRKLLVRLTGNRFMGVATGAGITAVIQSSSVTSVLVIGLISSQLMTLPQAIGVIMGANIGTTVTAQIIALDVTDYALVAVALGFLASMLAKSERKKARGEALMGLGLVFFGMSIMGEAMEPLHSYQPFVDLMSAMSNPLLAIAVGAGFTALIQSSSATTSLVIVLAARGLIPLEAGIGVIFGANIGTSVTALLAAIGKPRDALRAAYVHSIFNVIGVLLWLPFIGVLASLVVRVGGDTAREIANAHTFFNVGNTLVFIWFTNQFAALATRLAPDRPVAEEEVIKAKYLDHALLSTPSLALDRARLEMLRMADRIRTMYEAILPGILHGDRQFLLDIEQMDDEVDALHGHIIVYLGEVSKAKLDDESTVELLALMTVVNDLEAIGDIVETNLVALGLDRLDRGLEVSSETEEVISDFHATVSEALDLAMLAVTQKNELAAHQVSAMKKTIRSMELGAIQHEAGRLVADRANRVDLYRLETDVITHLNRIYFFARRVARSAVPAQDQARV